MKQLLIMLCLVSCINSFSQSTDETVVMKLLNDQSAAWNRGDISGFMKGYWENDSLMFIGKNGVTHGWTRTLDNYKRNYPDTASMGKLVFTIISAKNLSQEYFHVIGKWHLQRSIGDLEGHFTLLLRKIKGRWVIIADHSS